MKLVGSRLGLGCGVLCGVIAACGGSSNTNPTGVPGSGASASGSAGGGSGSASAGSASSGSNGSPSSGSVSSGVASSGQPATSGAGASGSAAGNTSGAGGSGGTASGASGAAGGSGSSDSGAASDADGGNPNYPPPPRAINVTPGGVFNGSYMGQPMYLDHSKPIQAKLILLLGGICTGVGAGGFESFAEQYGFHVFGPKTDTCLDGGKVPQSYVTTLKTNPNDMTANAQIGDSRMELWDGMTRVNWYTVPAASSIVAETVAAIKYAMNGGDPGGDWGYFLDATGDGLRTSDVWVVGYSWGSQTWAMISAYVPFGRVITTSGPQDEGFPNALWITQPSANGTPGDRKYMLVGFNDPYPSTAGTDSEVMSMVTTVTNAGWIPPVTNVMLTSPGPYTSSQHLFAMVGGNGGISPGGHTVFCTNNPMNQWIPLCKYVMNVQ